MMNKTLLTLLLASLLALPLVAAPPQGFFAKPATPSDVASIDNTTYINANTLLMFVTNHGNFCRDLSDVFGYDAGTFWPFNTVADIESGLLDNYCLYASGLWVGGKVADEVRIIISEYSDEYVPGPMVGGTFVEDNPAFKVYKLYSDSLEDNPNDDYTNWPVSQGAPVDGEGKPAMIGDQMLWSVYNDADPDQHTNDAGETEPLGLEVRHTTFAFDRQDALGNIVFLRFQVFNKGGNTIDSCFLSLWSDPDLGGAGDDLVGCDTNLSVGFVYNATNNDQQYGSEPPAVGYDFFQGPLEFTGDDADTARMWDTTFAGYRNLGMSSFNKYINGTDPDNFTQTYNYMRGLNRDGSVYTFDGNPTKYFVSGDPVKGTGDLDFNPADRRFMMSTGPITFAPGDSTEILAAIIVGDGINRKSSVSVMKFYDRFAQNTYEANFEVLEPPAAPVVTPAVDDNRITLSWTTISQDQPGSYPFEGYTVWQGETPSGPWTQVVNFDIVNTIEDIVDETIDPGSGALEIRLVKDGSNQGVYHDIILDWDYINDESLRNSTEYYYKVDAYSYLLTGVPKTLTSSDIVSAIPQSPIAGTTLGQNFDDAVEVTHVGGSDGTFTAWVTDSYQFDDHMYQVTFSDTIDIYIDTIYDPVYPGDPDEATFVHYNTAWHLVDLTDGDTITKWQWDQSGDTTFELIEGILFQQAGPPLEGNDWEYYSVEPPNISPIVAVEDTSYQGDARWFSGAGDGELLFGGVYLAYNFQGSTVPAPEYKPIHIVWRPMESYTDLNGNGTFTTGEPYVAAEGLDTSYAFMYETWGDEYYSGFHEVPFSAYDVSDPGNPRKLMLVVRDRDQNNQWDWHEALTGDDTLNMPNGGDFSWNYVWIMDLDYDPTGTYYGDGTGGTIGFMGDHFGGSNPSLWNLWLDSRGVGGFLAEECTLELIPNYVNSTLDTFTFTLEAPMYSTGEDELERINVVPNPFYLYGPYDPAPGNYQITFQHLPGTCTIKIFNLGGDLVRTIDKDDPSTSIATWDARTENNLPVASGIYIYVVEAPGFGTKIGKMAVFTEVEVLDVF